MISLNRELNRRSNVIGIFPNAASLNRLMGSVLLEYNEKNLSTSCVRYKKEDLAALNTLDYVLKKESIHG